MPPIAYSLQDIWKKGKGNIYIYQSILYFWRFSMTFQKNLHFISPIKK